MVFRAFREVGFIFVYAPEISVNLPRVYDAFRKVFDLSENAKQKYARPEIFYQRGWMPPFSEIGIACRHSGPDRAPVANAYEHWFMGPDLPSDHPVAVQYPELNSPNVWPDEVPEFRIAMEDLYNSFPSVGRPVWRAIAPRIGKDPYFFDEITRFGSTVMRALHYPAVKPEDVGKIIYGCRHTDINLFTILPASTREGLWVRTRSGNWTPGVAPEGYVIVQVGDMLEYLTGGEFFSAEHEVRAPEHPTIEGRLSAAMFIHPRSDVVLGFGDEDTEKSTFYPKKTAGVLLAERLEAIGLGNKKTSKRTY